MIFCCQTRSIATPAEQRRDNNSQQPALHHSKRAVVKATTKYYTLRRPRTFSQARAAPAPPPSRQQKPAASLPVTSRRLAGRHRRPWGLFPPDRRNRLTRRPTGARRRVGETVACAVRPPVAHYIGPRERSSGPHHAPARPTHQPPAPDRPQGSPQGKWRARRHARTHARTLLLRPPPLRPRALIRPCSTSKIAAARGAPRARLLNCDCC